jgi:hypothetical protein
MLMIVMIHVAGPVAPRKEPPLPTEYENGWESEFVCTTRKREKPLVALGIESQLPDGPTQRLSSAG